MVKCRINGKLSQLCVEKMFFYERGTGKKKLKYKQRGYWNLRVDMIQYW